MTREELWARFAAPVAAYRPMMFWIWNGEMDEGRIRDQVADLAAKGCGGFFIHPMGESFRLEDFIRGIRPPYLSEEYFDAVAVAVDEARIRGLYAWLYDEGGWPSGTAQGHVLSGHPEYTAQVLVLESVAVASGARPEPPEGAVAALGWSRESGVKPLELRGGGVEVPTGVTQVLFACVRPVEGRVNLLSPAAVARFIEVTHERYAARVGQYFGSVIPGIFTDEPSVVGRVGSHAIPWTGDMLKLFLERRGFDLVPLLPLLFAEQSVPPGLHDQYEPHVVAQVRCEFCELWTDLYREAYWEQINRWCETHGLIHTGHVGGEDTLLDHGRQGFGHFFKTAGALHAPGVDVIWRQLMWGQDNFGFPRFAASAAHQRPGQGGAPEEGSPFDNLVVSETNGAYGLGLTFEQMRWLVDYQVLCGVNLIAPMAYSYDTSAGTLFRTQDYIGPKTPQWELYDGFADYVGRLCAVMRSGVALADVAVYYPIEAVWADPDGSAAQRAWRSLRNLSRALDEEQVPFDYLDAATLLRARIGDGIVETDGQFYGTVIVPDSALLPLSVMQRLMELYESGGRVAFPASVPELCSEYGRDEAYSSLVDRFLDAAVVMGEERAGLVGGDTQSGLDEAARWDGMAAAFGMPPRPLEQFPAKALENQVVLVVPEEETGRLARLLALRAGRYSIQPAGVVPSLRLTVRDLDPIQVALVMNEGAEELDFEIDVVSDRQSVLERWDPRLGEAELLAVHKDISELTRVPMRLQSGESALLVLSPREGDEPGQDHTSPPRPERTPVVIEAFDKPDAVWVVREYRVEGGDVVVLEGERVGRSLPAALGTWENLGLTDFSGCVAYEFSFPLAPEYLEGHVYLDLGEVRYAARVELNGKTLPGLLWPPFRVEVSALLQEHDNRMRVEVTNTLANQACAERVVAEARARGWFNSYYQRALPMMTETLSSGLIGPVRLWV